MNILDYIDYKHPNTNITTKADVNLDTVLKLHNLTKNRGVCMNIIITNIRGAEWVSFNDLQFESKIFDAFPIPVMLLKFTIIETDNKEATCDIMCPNVDVEYNSMDDPDIKHIVNTPNYKQVIWVENNQIGTFKRALNNH